MDVAHLEAGGDPGGRRGGAGGSDGGRREVEAGHRCALAGPRERVEPEVALEVDEPSTGHVAELVDLEVPQRGRGGVEEEPIEVVEVAGGMDRDPLLPPGAVPFLPRFIHPASLSPASSAGAGLSAVMRCYSRGYSPPWAVSRQETEPRPLRTPVRIGPSRSAEMRCDQPLRFVPVRR
jgi:hypothetical protein